MHRILWIILLISAVAAAKPTVYFIRHGEKPENGDEGLSTEGLARAQCLRHIFGDHSEYDIGYIMAQQPRHNGKRSRPFQTVKPVAKDIGIKIDTSCDRDDIKCVLHKIKHYRGSGNILISWEHHQMSHLAEKLGDHDAPYYPVNRFDLIWTMPAPYHKVTKIKSEKCPGLDIYREFL
ncbi:hypothetical protein N7495_009096 [Penicillium taxi]|uniref:uncharacterized protein n=1 Tax=Penicillium taxi TaxID=168475 RepID=UPI0025450408|nr:uncharacterized protein N7495_009096 [Penicillium taxi]KAJ5889055.1 hypothetical protein N7495_009096 [Penicillium taxi]